MWRVRPGVVKIGLGMAITHYETKQIQPGPNDPILKQYLLGQVFVDAAIDQDFGSATGGIINQLTTFFEATNMGDLSEVDFSTHPDADPNPETGFFEISEYPDGSPVMARLSFTRVKSPDADEFPADPADETIPYNPFVNGIMVNAKFVHNTAEGWIEVVASDLMSQLPDQLRIRPNECVYIGLTPIFESVNTAPFSGRHLTNVADINGEGPSAVRLIDPGPAAAWMGATDDVTGDSLYATMDVRGPALPEIFLSFSDFGVGDAITNTSINATVSDTITAYVWVNDAVNIDTGAGLDVATSDPSVIEFTAAETLDFDIVVGGTPIVTGTRWGDFFGPAVTTNPDSIVGLNALTIVSGTGILTSQVTGNMFEDVGHDISPGTEAFLFASIEMNVVNAGTTQISLSKGSINIVHDGVALDPVFGAITVNAAVSTPGVLGDTNGDGDVNLLDVESFVAIIVSGTYEPAADINEDGLVNLADIAPFVALLQSQ